MNKLRLATYHVLLHVLLCNVNQGPVVISSMTVNGRLQDFSHFFEQPVGSKRLLQEADSVLQHAAIDDGIAGVPGHVEKKSFAAPSADALRDLAAAGSGQHHVGEKKMN